MNFANRINQVRQILKEKDCQALLVENPIDIFYLTGQYVSTGKLLINSHDAILLIDGRYYETCKKNAPCTVLQTPENTLASVLIEPYENVESVGFDAEHTTYRSFVDLAKVIQPSVSLIAINSPVKKIREKKDAEEIALLKEAALLGSQGYDYVCNILREGISEDEVALELEYFWRKKGGRGVAFEPIIAFGSNSSMPHYRAGQARLVKGQSVLIDIGVNYKHYHSDMTRVVFFGEPDPKILEIYQIVLQAQEAALKNCRPEIRIGDLDEIARSTIGQHGYRDQFSHSLGHGIGLEIHEYPLLRNKPPEQDQILQSGMVITIEPGIYLPDVGGVRIEDTVVITDDGYQDLTLRSKEVRIL